MFDLKNIIRKLHRVNGLIFFLFCFVWISSRRCFERRKIASRKWFNIFSFLLCLDIQPEVLRAWISFPVGT
jgi:hypothetical protein